MRNLIETGKFRIDLDEASGELILRHYRLSNNDANITAELLGPHDAVDLATKIINHCYPFTIPKRIKDA